MRFIANCWTSLFLLVAAASAEKPELLALYEVVNQENEGAWKAVQVVGDEEVELWLAKDPIVISKDVADAYPSPLQADAISVTLSEEGGRKLGEATKGAAGDMRIAILIRGELISAPFVMQQLGKRFMVEGFNHPEELHLIVWQLEGKSDQEIAELLRKAQVDGFTPEQNDDLPELEYYTDEEYAVLKRERAKMGMFYIDELPTDEELNKRLKKGMSTDEVVELFGDASHVTRSEQGEIESMTFVLAPEKRTISNEVRPSAFSVQFHESRVSSFGVSVWSGESRAPKPSKLIESHLDMKLPGDGFADEQLGTSAWLEQIEFFLREGHEKPHANDYLMLINLIWTTAITEEGGKVDANCSAVKTLASGFVEVEELRKKAAKGRIALADLSKRLEPYIMGEKELPKDILGK